MDTMESCETQAKRVGNSPAALKRRLLECVLVLRRDMREAFTLGSHFDFATKRLYPHGGNFYLQWRLRLKPKDPESYKNQQTNRGIVTVEYLNDERSESCQSLM